MASSRKKHRNKSGGLEQLKYSILSGTSAWKNYDFEVKGNVYLLRQNPTKPQRGKEAIVLSEITRLEQSKEDSRVFIIHFSGLRRNWILRAHSQEEKRVWMEALVPGSYRSHEEPMQPYAPPPAPPTAPPLASDLSPPPPYPPNACYPNL